MEQELQLIHQKLNHIVAELAFIKTNMQYLGSAGLPLSIRQAAEYLHLSQSRIYDLVYRGQLKPLQHRKHGRILFTKETLNQYLYEKGKSL